MIRHPLQPNIVRRFLLLFLLTCLVGCSKRFTQRDPAIAENSPAATAARQTLRVNLAGLPGMDEAQASALARAWEAASGVRAEIALTGTGAADVVIVSSATLGDAVDAKQITALPDDSSPAGQPAEAREALTLENKTYALPLTARLRVLAYDPDRLRLAGLDDRPAPTLEALRAQWQEAARAAAPASATGEQPSADTGLVADVTLFAAAFGGRVVSEEGTLTLTSRPVVQGIEYLKTLHDKNLLSSSAAGANPPFALTYLDSAPLDARAIAPLPVALAAYDAAARPFVVTGEVYGVAVSASASDRALAERFARFVADPVVARGWLGARSLSLPSGEGSLLARLAARITVPGGPLTRAKNRAVLDRYARAALEGTLPANEALARAAAEIEGKPAPSPPDESPKAPIPSPDPAGETTTPATKPAPPAGESQTPAQPPTESPARP